jgi:CRISPR-associated endonuclease/helicase Cas3
MKSKKIVDDLGGKAHVYDPFVLLRTLQLWKTYPYIDIPKQIRELLEETYSFRDDDPESWNKLYEDAYGKVLAHRQKALMSSNIWNVALPDEEGVQTRLNDVETVSVVLCRNIGKKNATFVDDKSAELGGDKFLLPTAQAIHKNLVKVPRDRCFERDRIVACDAFADYLRGVQTVGIVADDGSVKVEGLKTGVNFFYSNEMGLVIKK